MEPSEFLDLVAGYDPAWICSFLQIHPRTLKRWKEGTAAVPYATAQLLKLKLTGDIASFAGCAWAGFYLRRNGKLEIPYFRRGLAPEQIQAMFFELQELHYLRRELRRLNTELWAFKKVRSVTHQGERSWKSS